MLTALKAFLRVLMPPVLYAMGLGIAVWSALKDAWGGFVLLVFLIPQPNIWYKFHAYPMGKDYIDLLYGSVLLGLLLQGKMRLKGGNTFPILLMILFSYASVLNSSIRYAMPLPITLENQFVADWKNYAQMIFFYFIALSACRTEKDRQTILLLMAFTLFFVSLRSYRNFSGGASFAYDKRVGGPFEAVGLGANHLGAFVVHFSALFLGMFFFETGIIAKVLLAGAVLMGLHPLFFSYSRAAYVAAYGVIAFYGLVKKRLLLVLVVLLPLAWQTLLPVSVVDRISMTETSEGQLESSAATRIQLWDKAIELFERSPVIGCGFGSFGFEASVAGLTDTHNFYLKQLSEQGIVGLCILMWILVAAVRSGAKLFCNANTVHGKGLGLGFMGCVIAVIITNIFGDRWSYFVLGSYFWITWGLVDAALDNIGSGTRVHEGLGAHEL
ncbi:MAG: O-antigen ligase family protein [Deltaproteobacteria bacterium]|nr:O-antigen ligase family protein [Deltaproteobacteria bacterium]